MITQKQIQTNLAMAIKYSGMTHLQIAKLVGVTKSCNDKGEISLSPLIFTFDY
ncbi:MAG: hypothetical protein K2L70_02550 [Clostridia bacterium]|nr:hypothetical protein [Clostridia bacterium]